MVALTWDIAFILGCSPVVMLLAVVQLLALLFYVRRRAPLLLHTRPITPYLFLVFVFLRGVNTAIAEGYRLGVTNYKPDDTGRTAILFSEYFYVWALFFVACIALMVQVLQQVVVKHRLEANKQSLFQLYRQSSTANVEDNTAEVTRLRQFIQFQRLLSSKPLAVIVLIALLSVYLGASAVCITVYYTVISKMSMGTISTYKLTMFLVLICIPAVLFSIVGALLLTVDALAACIDIAHMRRNAVSWSRIRLWLLNYIIDRPHYLRLETLTVLVMPIIGIAYVGSFLLSWLAGFPSSISPVITWLLNFVLLLYPGGGVLIIVVIVRDLQQLHKKRRTATSGRAKNSMLWEESEDFKTYMCRILMSVGDGSKNASVFLGMMQQCKKECSTENMYSARELLFMIEELKKVASLAPREDAHDHTEDLGLTQSDSLNQLNIESPRADTPLISINDEDSSSSEDPVAAATRFEATFESVRLRWQSFLDLYIRDSASLEVNLTANLRQSALTLEVEPSQVESVITVLNRLLGGVLINLQDTYTRFEQAFEAGAFIEQLK